MPPREPKARYLTREYIADRDFMTTLGAVEREWYLLTSLFADDAGYLEWDLEDNAANVYRYEHSTTRRKRIERTIEKLGPTRFLVLPCGQHALMPRVAKRPRPGGRGKDTAIRDDHVRRHPDPEPKPKRSRKSARSRVEDDSQPEPRPSPVPNPRPNPSLARAPRGARGGPPTSLGDALAGTPFGEALAARKGGAG